MNVYFKLPDFKYHQIFKHEFLRIFLSFVICALLYNFDELFSNINFSFSESTPRYQRTL